MTTLRKRKAVKQINRKVILNIFRNSGEISVSELSKKVDLSKTTLMKIINYYIGKGLGSGVIMENEIKRGGMCMQKKRFV